MDMIFKGMAVSDGIAVGRIAVYRPFAPGFAKVFIDGGHAEAEFGLFLSARDAALTEIGSLPDSSGIMDVHSEMLTDPVVEDEIRQAIEGEGKCVRWAVADVLDVYEKRLAENPDSYFRSRAADVRDVKLRLLRCLDGEKDPLASLTGAFPVDEDASNISILSDSGQTLPSDRPAISKSQDGGYGAEKKIICARELAASEAAALRDCSLGWATESGGAVSHASILARSFGIPALVGITDLMDKAERFEGSLACLDSSSGTLTIGLSPDEAAAFIRKGQVSIDRNADIGSGRCSGDAVTKDGYRVKVMANVSSADDFSPAADGAGLVRTEFIFMNRAHLPSEDEQLSVYSRIAAAFYPNPVSFRTLDIGLDKSLPCLNLPEGEKRRGLELSLANEDLFRAQIRAIAGAGTNARIMFPMVKGLPELERAVSIVKACSAEIGRPVPLIGAMIETPAAAENAAALARLVDFASIGTNDLTQLALGKDRLIPDDGELDWFDPAVLRLIDGAVRAFSSAGKEIGVCGEMASNGKGAMLLMGIGVRTLSVRIPRLDSIRKIVMENTMKHMAGLAGKALKGH
ncbi:MAG: putative PEP-binding protein [Sphaerochaetaceae bacterium]